MKFRMILAWALIVLAAVAVIGLALYELLIAKTANTTTLVRAGLILAGLVLTSIRLISGQNASRGKRQLAYQEVYGDLIGDAFESDPKAKKAFYRALDDFNRNNHMAAANRLKKLLTPSSPPADRFVLFAFMGIILEDVCSWQEAIRFYKMALEYRTHKTVVINLAFCYDRGGYPDTAIDTYQDAIQLAPNDPIPSNNIAVICLRQSKYEEALEYAHAALRIDGNFKSALTSVAIANAMLGNTRAYEEYYRRAVANGADGEGIKERIQSLQSSALGSEE